MTQGTVGEFLATPGETPDLFDRSWRVTIQTSKAQVDPTTGVVTGAKALESTEHDITFKITKTIKSEPNKCTLTIFNLNAAQRNAIAALNPDTTLVHAGDKAKVRAAARKNATHGIGVKIEAGYSGKNSLLWIGDLRSAESTFQSPNWTTKLDSGAGEKVWANARLNVSYGPKTPTETALRDLVKELGVGQGNIEEIIATLRLNTKVFPQGTVMSGRVSTLLNDYCRSADIEWSIQDGVIQFTPKGKALKGTAVLISPQTGMLGSPKVDIDGILTVKTILIPNLRPGRILVVKSAIDQNEGNMPTEKRRAEGNWRAESIVYDGQSDGANWGCTIKAVRY